MIEKLDRKDVRLIVICVAVSVISLAVVLPFFRTAFPEASIQFELTQDETKERAERFLSNRTWDVTGYKYAKRFVFDHEAKTFLERELEAEEAGRIFDGVNGWRWANRWFRPAQKEEFRVDFSTTGKIAFFDHMIPENAAGDSLDQAVALDVATFFLTGRLGWDMETWEQVESNTEIKEKRHDHFFVWRKKGFDVSGGSHRIEVRVQGSEVGQYREWIEIPDAWERDYERLRSHNELTSFIATVFIILTTLLIFGAILVRMRKRDVRWKTAFTFGGVVAVLMILEKLNTLPEWHFFFNTQDSYGLGLAGFLFGYALTVPLLLGLYVALLIAGAETLYRDHYPRQVAFRNILSADGLKTKSFFSSAVVGITLTFFVLAFQTVFYLVSTRLGGWSPTEVKNINMLGTAIPWIGVLLGGLLPAITEESISRMFSIPFLQRYGRSTILAVVVSAAVWGFAHTDYPGQPFYIRGVEVTLVGIVAGFVFLRFGILALLIWHFSIDAAYSSLVLIGSGNAYYVTTGVVCAGIVCIPLIYAIVSGLRLKGFLGAEELTNEKDVSIAPLEEEEIERYEKARIEIGYTPITRTQKRAGLAVALVGVIVWLIARDVGPGRLIQFDLTRKGAIETADSYLTDSNPIPEGYRQVVESHRVLGGRKEGEMRVDEYAWVVPHYIVEHGGGEALRRVYTEHMTPSEWRVRFFKPLEQEEYNVYVDSRDGTIAAQSFVVADTAYRPSISAESALAIAKNFLRERGHDLAGFEVVEQRRIEEKNRVDHFFKFQSQEDHPGNVGDSRLVLNVKIRGDRVGFFNSDVKVPEEWVRDYGKKTFVESAQTVAAVVLFLGLITVWLVTAVRLLRHGRPRWKAVLLASFVISLVTFFLNTGRYATFFMHYETSVTIENHVAETIGLYALGIIVTWFGFVILFLSVDLMHRDVFRSFLAPYRRVFARDTLVAVAASLGVWFLVESFGSLLGMVFPERAIESVFNVPEVSGFFPAVDELEDLLSGLLLAFLLLVCAQYLYRRYLDTRRREVVVLTIVGVVVFAAFAGEARSPLWCIGEGLLGLVAIGLLFWLWRWYWRGNPLSLFMGIFVLMGVESVLEFVRLSHPFFQVQGWIVLVLTIAPIVLLLFESARAGKEVPTGM